MIVRSINEDTELDCQNWISSCSMNETDVKIYFLCRSDFAVIRKRYLWTDEIQTIRFELTVEWIVEWYIDRFARRMANFFRQSSGVVLRTALNAGTGFIWKELVDSKMFFASLTRKYTPSLYVNPRSGVMRYQLSVKCTENIQNGLCRWRLLYSETVFR